ncbi:MAG: DUF58 domain-containing protein [Phycisphaerales bacterium]
MERSIGRVRFGPGSVVYIVVSVLIAFAAFYTQANLLFWVLGLVVGAMIVSACASVVLLRGIEIHRLTPSRGAADEPLVLRYHIVNTSRMPCFGLEIVESWSAGWRGRSGTCPVDDTGSPRLAGRPHGWVLHVGPSQSIQAEATCWPTRRGLLRFEKVIVRSGFPFGIFRKSIDFPQTNEVLIHPPQRRLSRQAVLSLSSRDIGQGKHADRGGGHDEFFGLRPYRPGDSYKLIDWKHSARGSSLVSREMAKARPPHMLILLDLKSPDNKDNARTRAQEEAINLSGALIREAYLHGIHVGLAVHGVACPLLPIHNSQAHRQRLLDSLAQLELSKTKAAQPQHTAHPTVIVKVRPPDTENGTPEAVIESMSRHDRGRAYLSVVDVQKTGERRAQATMN